MNGIINILKKEISGLHEAAFLLGFFALASQILALFRDRVLAHTFGASGTLDVYYAAFRIPDFIFITIASFVSITVLIPFLSEHLSLGGALSHENAREFLSTVFSVFIVAIVAVSVIVFFTMPILAPIVAPGFSEAQLTNMTMLSRILLLSPILLGLSNLLGSVTQIFKRFFVYSLSPVLYNLGIIMGVVFFYPVFGLSGLALGVILGAIFHVLIQVPVVMENGIFPRFSFNFDMDVIRRVVALSIPRTITLSASHFSLIVIIALASTIYNGSISIFNFAFNLQSVPLSIIGVSYSLAAFPTLAGLFSRGERDKFAEHIVVSLRHIIFWSLPIMGLFIVLRAQIVRVILGSGSFSWSDTKLTAAALALFSISILAQGIVILLVRGFYAAGETKVPLLVNVVLSLLTIGFSFGLLYLFENILSFRYFMESLLRVDGIKGTAILMLPLAYSLGSIINAFALWIFFEGKYVGGIPRALSRATFEGFAAAVLVGFVAYLSLTVFGKVFDINTFIGIFTQGFLAGLIGIIFGVFLLKLLQSRELADVRQALHERFWKAEVIVPEVGEL